MENVLTGNELPDCFKLPLGTKKTGTGEPDRKLPGCFQLSL